MQEFSLTLMRLLEEIKQSEPHDIMNAEVIFGNVIHRELKQLICCQLTTTLLEVCGEAI